MTLGFSDCSHGSCLQPGHSPLPLTTGWGGLRCQLSPGWGSSCQKSKMLDASCPQRLWGATLGAGSGYKPTDEGWGASKRSGRAWTPIWSHSSSRSEPGILGVTLGEKANVEWNLEVTCHTKGTMSRSLGSVLSTYRMTTAAS